MMEKMKNPNDIHPLTWNLKMMVWKMIFLFKQLIFRFHVNFHGVYLKHPCDIGLKKISMSVA